MLNRSFVPIVEVPRNRKCHQQGHWNARTTMFSTHVVRPDCDWNASKNAKECVTCEHVDPSISLRHVERTSGCLFHYPAHFSDRNDDSDLPPFTGTFFSVLVERIHRRKFFDDERRRTNSQIVSGRVPRVCQSSAFGKLVKMPIYTLQVKRYTPAVLMVRLRNCKDPCLMTRRYQSQFP